MRHGGLVLSFLASKREEVWVDPSSRCFSKSHCVPEQLEPLRQEGDGGRLGRGAGEGLPGGARVSGWAWSGDSVNVMPLSCTLGNG